DDAADADGDPFRVGAGQCDAAVGDGLAGGDDRELAGPVYPADLLRGEAGGKRVEVALGGDLGAESGRVEQADAAGVGTAGGEQVPVGFPPVPAGSDDAHSDDHRAPGPRPHLAPAMSGLSAAAPSGCSVWTWPSSGR